MKDTIIVLAIEQGGAALRLVEQNSGYLELLYQPKGKPARGIGLFDPCSHIEAFEEFHTQAAALKAIGQFGRTA